MVKVQTFLPSVASAWNRKMWLTYLNNGSTEHKQRRRRRQRGRKKRNRFIYWQNNNLARAPRFLVRFFAFVARLQREVPNFTFCRGREHSFFCFSWSLIQSFRNRPQKNLPTRIGISAIKIDFLKVVRMVFWWGPFLDSPGNFSGPKSNIQIQI